MLWRELQIHKPNIRKKIVHNIHTYSTQQREARQQQQQRQQQPTITKYTFSHITNIRSLREVHRWLECVCIRDDAFVWLVHVYTRNTYVLCIDSRKQQKYTYCRATYRANKRKSRKANQCLSVECRHSMSLWACVYENQATKYMKKRNNINLGKWLYWWCYGMILRAFCYRCTYTCKAHML